MTTEASETATTTITIKADDLRKIALLVHAAGTDKDRPILGCVELVAEDDTITATATNSYILATVTVPFQGEPFEGSILVPAKELAAAVKAVPKSFSGPAVLHIDGRWLTVESGNTRSSIALCDGRYPNWRPYFPEGDGVEVSKIALNPRYIYNLSRTFDERAIPMRLKFHGEHKQVVVEGPHYWRGIVMPVRV